MKSLSNKKSDKKSNVLSKESKKINQSTYIPKYKVKSIQKMKAKHRSRINDTIDEISDNERSWVLIELLQQQTRAEISLGFVSKIN